MLHRIPGADDDGGGAPAVPAPLCRRLPRRRDVAGRELHRLPGAASWTPAWPAEQRRNTRTHHAHDTAVPRRSCRQPAPPGPTCSPRATTSRPGTIDATALRAVEDAAIADVVAMQAEVGTAVRDRRRVPPRVLAHGLHLPARRDQQGARQPGGEVPQRVGHDRVHPGRAARRQQDQAGPHDLRRRLPVPAVGRRARRRPSSPSRRRTWSTTGAARRRSTRTSIPTWRSSGPTCRPPTPSRCGGSPRSAAGTCSSTTPAWRT